MIHAESALRVPAELKNLATIRAFFEETAAALAADSAATLDLLQAVDECATNIVVHGYRGQAGVIEIRVRRDADDLVVRLIDQAPPFDPTRLPPPDITLPLDKRPIGGMGVFLSRRLIDRMAHRATAQGGNELTLARKAF